VAKETGSISWKALETGLHHRRAGQREASLKPAIGVRPIRQPTGCVHQVRPVLHLLPDMVYSRKRGRLLHPGLLFLQGVRDLCPRMPRGRDQKCFRRAINHGQRVGWKCPSRSEVVALTDVDVIPAYPITRRPTLWSTFRAGRERSSGCGIRHRGIRAQRHEHLCGCFGDGARVFTSTSSQGYALMSEICYIAASLRLPIVMAVANRR